MFLLIATLLHPSTSENIPKTAIFRLKTGDPSMRSILLIFSLLIYSPAPTVSSSVNHSIVALQDSTSTDTASVNKVIANHPENDSSLSKTPASKTENNTTLGLTNGQWSVFEAIATILLAIATILGVLLGIPGKLKKIYDYIRASFLAPGIDPLWKKAKKLSKRSPNSTALALVKLINKSAVEVFESTDPDKLKQDSKWNAIISEYSAISESLVQPLPKGDNATSGIIDSICELLLKGRNDHAGHSKIWLIGKPGTGKTTLMTGLFFELIRRDTNTNSSRGIFNAFKSQNPHNGTTARNLTPVLLRPDIIGHDSIEKIIEPDNGSEQFNAFIKLWVENRGIKIPSDEQEDFYSSIKREFEAGNIVLLMDGYDELQRYDRGKKSYDSLLGIARFCVTAGRLTKKFTETHGGGEILETREFWSDDLIKLHIQKRFRNKNTAWKQTVSEPLTNTAPNHWSRIPVFLNLILSDLSRVFSHDIPDTSYLMDLLKGKHKLFNAIWQRALTRLRKKYGENNVWEEKLEKNISEVAAYEYLNGDFPVTRLSNDENFQNEFNQLTDLTEILHVTGHKGEFVNEFMRDFFLSLKLALCFEQGKFSSDFYLILESDYHNKNLLTGISYWLLKRDQSDEVIWSILNTAKAKGQDHASQKKEPTSCSPAYLLELIAQIRIETSRSRHPESTNKELRRKVDFRHHQALDNLDLQGTDLHLFNFHGVNFNNSRLCSSNLQFTKFYGCHFINTDLSAADARGAEFIHCNFRDHEGKPDKISLTDLRIEKEGIDNLKDADWQTIDTSRSRYHGEFGRLFFNAQAGFLGSEYPAIEDGYTGKIKNAVEYARSNTIYEGEPIYLVDLMAGGSSQRLKDLLGLHRYSKKSQDLHVLAIDRNLHQLQDVLEHRPERFKALAFEIGACENGYAGTDEKASLGFDLMEIIKSEFGDYLTGTDIIIAKKAIHELPREQQPYFIKECFKSLKPGGKLILFADSPEKAVSEARYKKLLQLKDKLYMVAQKEADLNTMRDMLLDITFYSTQEEVAFFCNLWVSLKDWTNDNLRELKRRYFSSVEELQSWATIAGFSDPIDTVTGHYTLSAPKFNELGIQKVANHLERHGPEIIKDEHEKKKMSDWLSGRNMAKLNLLIEFTNHHLQNGNSRIGALIVDPRQPEMDIDFSSIDPVFGEIQPVRREVAFNFPVHVLEFEKPRI